MRYEYFLYSIPILEILKMRSIHKKFTDNDIRESFMADSIGRNQTLYYFLLMLDNVEECFSIALDGCWGSGKTIFVKQAQMLINALNQSSPAVEQDEREMIVRSFSAIKANRTEIQKPQIAVYYDAWEHDNDNDPMVSILFSISQSVGLRLEISKQRSLFEIIGKIADAVSGRSIYDVLQSIKGEPVFKTPTDVEADIHASMKCLFDEIRIETAERLVVFIDELDRCRPTYAVKLLERIEHYFDDDRLTFVFSTNIGQLQHTIKRYYGEQFDAGKYLNRFFDILVPLPEADPEKIYDLVGAQNDSHYLNQTVMRVLKTIDGIRDKALYMAYVNTSLLVQVKNNVGMKHYFDRQKVYSFMLGFIAPIILGLHVVDKTDYESFIHGENNKPMIDILDAEYFSSSTFADYLLDDNEVFERNDESPSDKTIVDLRSKLKTVYDAIFATGYKLPHGKYSRINVGEYYFDKNDKTFLINITGGLTGYSDFTKG